MLHSQLVIKNQQDELSRLAEWVNGLGDDLELSEQCLFRLDLILAEAVSNVIFYAYHDLEVHWIEISVSQNNDLLTIKLVDDGCPFNPLDRQELALPASLEEASVGGLGIHLVQRYANTCHYQRQADHNILTLVLRDEAGQ